MLILLDDNFRRECTPELGKRRWETAVATHETIRDLLGLAT